MKLRKNDLVRLFALITATVLRWFAYLFVIFIIGAFFTGIVMVFREKGLNEILWMIVPITGLIVSVFSLVWLYVWADNRKDRE